MKRSGWSRLVVGFLLTTAVACNPLTEEEPNSASTEPANRTLPATTIARQATTTSGARPEPSLLPPPQPTPLPTTGTTGWQEIGGEAAGLQIAAPPEWVNLSGRLDTSMTSTQLGLIVILLADSERTGSSLLAGKSAGTGAYAVGIVATLDLPANVPLAALTQMIEDLGPVVTPVGRVMPVTAPTTSGEIMGASIDVVGQPLIFGTAGEQDQRTRVLLFPSEATGLSVASQTQAIFLLSAPASIWEQVSETFNQMAETIAVHNLAADLVIGDGTANVLGDLSTSALVTGNLDAGIRDIWTFTTTAPRYATLTLTPEDSALDLTLAVISPSGQTITRIDNGYAGAGEVATDVLLDESGLYIVEVDEFFNESGRYTLSLVLTDTPLFGGGGRIDLGQNIQSELPANGDHIWTFDGEAGQSVSIVLTPDSPFDAILNLYGPDGRHLLSLDEGFSGDAEVVSGFALPLTGEYRILVSSFAGDGGAYALSLDEGGETLLNFYEAGDLLYGDVKRETLRASEAHAWFFQGKAGDEIVAEVVPIAGELDVDIWLLDPDVNRLDAQDEHLAGAAERIERILPRDGQYLILVRDFFGTAGEYEIRLSAMPVATPVSAGTLTYGQGIEGVLEPGQTALWTFTGRNGEVIDINLTPTDGHDLLFFIQDPAGNRVQAIDGGGAGETEQIAGFTLTADGPWGIAVKEFFGNGGAYTLTIQRR